MVDKECKVEKAPGAMLAIRLSYNESRRTELRPVKVLLSMQLIWLLRSILKIHEKAFNNNNKNTAYYYYFFKHISDIKLVFIFFR